MTQSAVSQQIAALENDYDVLLFKRMGRSIEPTPEGRALYDWSCPLLASLEGFSDRFRAMKNLEYGKLHIGTTEGASLNVAPLLTRFCGEFPLIRMSLRVDAEENLRQAALNGVYDFIVVDEILDLERDPSFQYITGEESGFSLIVPPAAGGRYAVGAPALAGETFLSHVQDPSLRSFVNRFFSSGGITPRRVLEIGNVNAIKRMVREGAGFSILGEPSVTAEIEAGHVEQVALRGLQDLKRRTLLLFPVKREIAYSAWAFRRLLESEKTDGRKD